MANKFNIHDWHYKNRLNEQESTNNDWKGLDAEVAKYIASTFATWMSPQSRVGGEFVDNPPFSKEYAKAPYFDKLVGGIMDIVNDYKGEEDLEEQNSLAAAGSGASFTPGAGEGYMSPNAFNKKKLKK